MIWDSALPERQSWWVVIVDDNEDDRAEVRRLLLRGSDRRYEFTEVKNGAAAIEVITASPTAPDAVVLDYMLPDMDGVEIMAALCDADGVARCPIVVTTGSGIEAGHEMLRAGAQDYIGKQSATPASLTRALENALERWTMACELRARRQALERSERRYHALFESSRESEVRLRLALEASHTGIWTWDIATDAVTWTPECYDLLGQTTESFAAGAAFFALLHPDDRARVEQTVRDAINARALYHCEFRVIHRDGRPLWVQNLGRCTYDFDGRPVRVLGTLFDVNARKVAELALEERERELKASVAEAERAVRSRDQLVSLISHDLRNPLTVFSMGIGMIQMQLASGRVLDPQKLAFSVERLARQAGRMNRILSSLFDIALLHAGRPLELTYAETDLGALVSTVVDACQRDSPGYRFEVHVAEPVIGTWDAARLERVIDNLVANAVKYSPKGGAIRIRVDSVPEPAGTWAVLRIEDEGIGVNPADKDAIFEWFQRGGNAVQSEISGTGVGLAAAREILAMHGGSIKVESELGKGSTFIVRLPTAPPS